MKAQMRTVLLLFLAGLAECFSLTARDNDDPMKLADGVYARIVSPDSDAVANAGFVVLEHSVLVFDTHFTPEAGQALLAAIRSVTDKPVRYVVNSHAHPDHTHGNQVFGDALRISSAAARRDMLESDLPALQQTIGIAKSQLEALNKDLKKASDADDARRLREQIKPREDYLQTMARLKILPATIALDENMTLEEGSFRVELLPLGPGHTDGDLVLFVPSAKIAFLGDLFFNEAIPNVADAKLLDWMKALGRILELDADRFVPGHGPVGTKKDVEKFLQYFEDLKSLVEPALARGDTPESAIRDIRIPSKYAGYKFPNFFASNVQKMYGEVKALELSQIPAEGPRQKEKPKK